VLREPPPCGRCGRPRAAPGNFLSGAATRRSPRARTSESPSTWESSAFFADDVDRARADRHAADAGRTSPRGGGACATAVACGSRDRALERGGRRRPCPSRPAGSTAASARAAGCTTCLHGRRAHVAAAGRAGGAGAQRRRGDPDAAARARAKKPGYPGHRSAPTRSRRRGAPPRRTGGPGRMGVGPCGRNERHLHEFWRALVVDPWWRGGLRRAALRASPVVGKRPLSGARVERGTSSGPPGTGARRSFSVIFELTVIECPQRRHFISAPSCRRPSRPPIWYLALQLSQRNFIGERAPSFAGSPDVQRTRIRPFRCTPATKRISPGDVADLPLLSTIRPLPSWRRPTGPGEFPSRFENNPPRETPRIGTPLEG